MVRPRALTPPSSRSRQIFSGAWGVAACVVLVLVLADVVGAIWMGQRTIESPPIVAPINAGVEYPRQLANEIESCPIVPVIGIGVMRQVVRVDGQYAYDPFTDARLRALTALERHATAGCPGAINRFGVMPKGTIALTYDDGPDPVYTPRVLKVLRDNGVAATFFVLGTGVENNPGVFTDLTSDQVVGDHTLTHPVINKLPDGATRNELVMSSRVITAIGHRQTRLFRPPYVGSDADSLRVNVRTILSAQQLGMTTVGFTTDTSDYEYGSTGAVAPAPILDDSGLMIVMHDGGGDREATVALTEKIIRMARDRKNPLRFITADELLPHNQAVSAAQPTWADNLAYFVLHTQGDNLRLFLNSIFRWSTYIIGGITLGFILMSLVGSFTLRRKYRSLGRTEVEEANYPKQVSVLMAAWNEQAGIERAVRRIFAYPYPFDVEVVVVDDGSTDNTPQILARLAGEFCQSPHKLVVLTAQNGGKAKALNRAILTGALHGAVTVMIDGDTLVDANTIPYLVRHFGRSPRLGAVAGRVGVLRIGKNPWQKCLIRWQLAKYNMDIGVTRMAQAVMGAILIVPGACCAYSTPLLVGMGGFRTDNLAEDAEVGVLVRWHGYEVRMDLDAVAYTETPIAFKALCRQQFRWAFGIYQVIFKHSRMMAHPVAFGPLAWFVMPYTLVSTILPLIVLPVNLIVTALAMTTHNWSQLLIYYAIFTAMQVILSVAGMISLREWSWDPVVALYFRPINDTIQLYVACRSIKAILLGRSVGWGSVPRVGDAVAVAAMSQSNPETAEA